MNKKLLALAVAAAFVAPVAAIADSGNVKISGNLHVSLDSLDGKNASVPTEMSREWNVASNSSNIVFSGDEDLGNGLSAVWQLATFVGMGSTGNGSNTWTNGNSFVGLSGKAWGTALLGKHDTPMKIVGRKVDLFGDQIGDSRSLIASGGIGDLRPDNVIAYISPTVSGFHAAVAYVTNYGDNTNVSSAAATGVTGSKTMDAWSALAMYENGPLTLAAAYENHNISRTDSTKKDEYQWRLAGGYRFGDTNVVALWQRADDLAGTSGNDRTVWGLGLGQKLGANTLKLQYYRAGDLNGASDTGANMWVLGADHAFSKRTTGYVAYARTNNDTSAAFSAFGGGHGDNPGTVTGKDPSGFSLGMKHAF